MVKRYDQQIILGGDIGETDEGDYVLYSDYQLLELDRNLWEKELSEANQRNEALEHENKILREGMKGDYDLDRWLDWVGEVKELEKKMEVVDGWHKVVKQCEDILSCLDTAESPIMSNLPNLIRDLKDARDFAESDKVDIKQHATLLADALKDINNDIGELPEVKICVSDVDRYIEMYAGLATRDEDTVNE